jgi:hypothetical protein
MEGKQLPAHGDVHQGTEIAEEKMTQWSMVNLSGVLASLMNRHSIVENRFIDLELVQAAACSMKATISS